ncbi:MAG: hypothetical protein JRJ42_05800 [Deltaproteobacteria bacterium]|nr:hypothetical protein [Deltaproteobacteria bacterium]MBW2019688.1 hypothetical protein [Deltaproteobacteria bacterium]MBW2074468.1 hypothetical protein [Deltaproteobacteria bacterium]RLB81686.1 MAG: hypothetical protein DRH17_08400 [Deltaproteobacteria bacterium]
MTRIKVYAGLILARTICLAACSPKQITVRPRFMVCRTIISKPSGAEIYGGKSPDELSYIGQGTIYLYSGPISFMLLSGKKVRVQAKRDQGHPSHLKGESGHSLRAERVR